MSRRLATNLSTPAPLILVSCSGSLMTGSDGAAAGKDGGPTVAGVISNASGTVKRVFARLGLTRFFDVIVDSTEVGIEKPDVRIFELALGQMNARAADAAYVGDVFKVDVVGARGAGMRAILIDPHDFHAHRECERVASLAELAGLLARGGR